MASEACCNAGEPAKGNYKGNGDFETAPKGTSVYMANPTKATRQAVLMVYDVFGDNEGGQYRKISDLMAERGEMAVVAPDLLGKQRWPEDKYPPPDREEFKKFLSSTASFEVVSPAIEDTLDFLHRRGFHSVALVGFCWGAMISMKQAEKEGGRAVKCVASAHPSLVDSALAQRCPVPVCLLPSGDEGAMADVEASLPKGSVVKEYKDMFHGWMCARADYSDEHQLSRAKDGVNDFIDFFRPLLT